MMHAIHERPRVVFGDECNECVSRSYSIEGLAQLDEENLAKLGALAAQAAQLRRRWGGSMRPLGASYSDMRAIETLRLAARVVYGSGITEEDAR